MTRAYEKVLDHLKAQSNPHLRWFRWHDGTEISADMLSYNLKRPSVRKLLEQHHGKAEVQRAKEWLRGGIFER